MVTLRAVCGENISHAALWRRARKDCQSGCFLVPMTTWFPKMKTRTWSWHWMPVGLGSVSFPPWLEHMCAVTCPRLCPCRVFYFVWLSKYILGMPSWPPWSEWTCSVPVSSIRPYHSVASPCACMPSGWLFLETWSCREILPNIMTHWWL